MDTGYHGASRADLTAAALTEWNGHVESILRGIGHALNNRAAALSAVLELARDPGEDPAVYASILGTEFQRVTELVTTVRAIGGTKRGDDTFTAADAITEAEVALSHHPLARERRVAFEAGTAPPLRAARWMYVRALITLGANAMLSGAGATIEVAGEDDWVVTRVRARAGVAPGTYVAEIACAMGGEPLPDGSGFRLPSLAAVRKREGRGG